MQNITLIGMPACGKSTLGVTLAEAINAHFIDIDRVIEQTYNKTLHELLDTRTPQEFIDLEGNIICSIHTNKTVIATGGSAVYNDKAMQYLSTTGIIVYIACELSEIASRIGDMTERGVVCPRPCTSLEELYEQRRPLYEKYANITVDLTYHSLEACKACLYDAVLNEINRREWSFPKGVS